MLYYLLQFAQRIDAGETGIPQADADTVVTNILNGIYFIAGLVAVIVIIIAGLTFINSGGDSGRVAKAKNQILYAVVGLIVVISAFAITNFVIGRF